MLGNATDDVFEISVDDDQQKNDVNEDDPSIVDAPSCQSRDIKSSLHLSGYPTENDSITTLV